MARDFDLEHDITWAERAYAEWTGAVGAFHGKINLDAQDDDPSHATDAYRAYARKKTVEAHLPTLRDKAQVALERRDRAYQAAVKHVQAEQVAHERSFDSQRLLWLKGEFASQLANAHPKQVERLRAAVAASDDSHKRRAFRSALNEAIAQRFSKDANQETRRWANLAGKDLQREAEADVPASLTEAVNTANEMANQANTLRRDVRAVGLEIQPDEFLRDGPFDHLLGVSKLGPSVAADKTEALVNETDWEI